MSDIAIIIVNYNGFDETIDCVKDMLKLGMGKYNIIIVDNMSSDDSVKVIREEFGDSITVLETGKNLGYAGGNNFGIKYAIEHGASYFCVMNNDVVIHEDFIVVCTEILRKNKDIAFAGPRIMDFDHKYIQSTGGKIDFLRGLTPLLNFGKEVDEETLKMIDCDFVSGACILTSIYVIKKIGLIPENYFAYYEETEWCYKAKKAGMKNVCVGATSIEHKGAVSMDKVSKLMQYLSERNKVLFIKRNCNQAVLWRHIMYLIIHTLYMAIRNNDKTYLKYYSFYIDGLLEKYDPQYYDFII